MEVKEKLNNNKLVLNYVSETMKHCNTVRSLMLAFAKELMDRALAHDESKFHEPEASRFAIVTPRLKSLKYGSEEYKESLKDLGPALDHHYESNSHHPEHYDDGVSGMNLLDIVEMLCDWKASGVRTSDGDIKKSIENNKERFNLSDDMISVFNNTVEFLEKNIINFHEKNEEQSNEVSST